jgi:hypothetical protein
MAISPTAEGFRAAFRRPSLTFAEITWRWVTGATVTAVFFFGLFEYLNTLPVSNGELLFLRTRQPYLVGEALAHIFRGSLSRGMMAFLLAAIMLGVLWMFTAAAGRIATVRGLLDYFATRRKMVGDTFAGGVPDVGEAPRSSLRGLVRLNFLRLAAALAAIFGLVGAVILAGFASPDAHPRPGLAFLLFLPLAGLISLAWSSLNWLLSLAGMFAVRDGEDAVGAISAAVSFSRERSGAVVAVSTWTGLAHLVAFVGATTVISMPLSFATIVPWRLVLAAVVLLTLGYFALADWLYMARLAGYICIAEMPEALLRPLPPVPPPALPVQTTIDRNELILSDLPNLAVET